MTRTQNNEPQTSSPGASSKPDTKFKTVKFDIHIPTERFRVPDHVFISKPAMITSFYAEGRDMNQFIRKQARELFLSEMGKQFDQVYNDSWVERID